MAYTRQLFAWSLSVLGALGLAGCDRKAATTPTSPTGRVVSLSPAVSVILKDLGLENQVVGRHAYEMVLDESLPVCGDQAGVNLEQLVAIKPDAVILQWGARGLPPRLTKRAAADGWVLHDAKLLTLADIRREVPEIAAVVHRAGGPNASDRVAAIQAEMDRAWSKRGDGFASVGRVLVLADTAPPSALGPGSFHAQILEAIGGVPAIRTGNAFQELTVEDVLALAPDAIVLIMPRSPRTAAQPMSEIDTAKRMGRLRELTIPANANGRIAVIDDPLGHTPSTAMIGLADELARVLEAWR